MKKFHRIFVDLDDTLYNTRQLKEDIYKVFEPIGISHDDFIRAYRQAAELPMLGYYNYTFPKQVSAVRDQGFDVNEEALVPKLENLLAQNYLLSGAENFLVSLKNIGEKLILLTAGNLDFQAKKIEYSGIKKFFDEVVQIDGGKDLALAPFMASNENVLFINDNLDENMMMKNKYPNLSIFSIINLSYWTEKDYSNSGIPSFNNFEEIKKHLSI
jgi:FMN phosphatase YigB (HAD superfamily)